MSKATPKYRMAVLKEGKTKTFIEVGTVASVTADELDSASGISTNFCYNLLAGMVSAEISKAYKSRGLPKLLPHLGKTQLDNLRKIMAVTDATRRKAWANKVAKSDRVRDISLTGLRSAITSLTAPPREPSAFNKTLFLAAGEKVSPETWALSDMALMYDLWVAVSPEETASAEAEAMTS